MKSYRIIMLLLIIIITLSVKTVKADEKANVTIGYNDINGHVIKEKHDKCTVGSNYTATAITINGYELTNETPKKQTIYCDGEFSNNIAFVYQVKGNKKEGSVKAHYLDTKGKKISEPDLRSGTPGVDYYITPKPIDGYTLLRIEGNNNGKFKSGEITVKFIYQKDGEVTTPDIKEDKKETKNSETKKIVTKKQTVKSTSNKKQEVKKEEIKHININDQENILKINNIIKNSLVANSKHFNLIIKVINIVLSNKS